jgi:eukaryotic-like serine/threonine-protein kinase
MAVAGAAVALAIVVRTVQAVSRPPLCRGAAQQLAGVWDGPRAEAVRRAFAASGKSYAADTFGRVRSILDAYAVAWQRMYTDACEATHLRGEQSADVLDLRMACLRTDQDELRALTDLLSSADGEVVTRSISAASAMTPIDRCADVSVLKAVVRPPEDRDTRATVDRLREQLSEVKVLGNAGRVGEGVRKAKPLVEQARALGYEPLLAEALDALGRVERWSGPFPEAEAALDEAMLVAEASRHDRLLAEAAVDKVTILGFLGRLDEVNRLVPRAEATLKRVGGDALLEGWIDSAIGQALVLNGRYAEALVMHQKALDAKRRVLPPDHWDVALSIGNVAGRLHELGRDAEALEKNEQAIAILEHALGQQHPDLALHVYNRGEIKLALGRISEARADFQRSLAIWQAELPANHLYNSYPLTGIGLAALADGQAVGDAIAPLERALAIREESSAAPAMRAETMFALARALWQAGPDREPDRARAVALAEEARDLLGADKPDDRRKVDDALGLWRPLLRKPAAASRPRRDVRVAGP